MRFAMRRLIASVPLILLAAGNVGAQESRATFGLGRNDTSSLALSLNWHAAPFHAGLGWAGGLWVTSRGAGWIGGGLAYTHQFAGGPVFVRGAVMPGLYRSGSDVNLGGPLQFLSRVEIGTELSNRGQISLAFEHRSNAGLYATNPGLNTVSVNYSLPLN